MTAVYWRLDSIIEEESGDGCILYATQIMEPNRMDYILSFLKFQLPKVIEFKREFYKIKYEDATNYIWVSIEDHEYYSREYSDDMSEMLDMMVARNKISNGVQIIGRL